jgi:Ala-tRNA(Pro) deacylase
MSAELPGAPRPGGTGVTDRLERWLQERGARFRVMEHAPVFTSEEAARVRGTPIEAGAKALVFLAADRPVHVVLPGARRVDNARLRAVLGTRTLRFATHAELLRLTGCAPGAVPPFGNLFGLPVFVDAALAERQEIAFSAGSNTVSIIMRGDDFLRLSDAHVHALTRPPAPGI